MAPGRRMRRWRAELLPFACSSKLTGGGGGWPPSLGGGAKARGGLPPRRPLLHDGRATTHLLPDGCSSAYVRRPRLLPGGAASSARDGLELPSSLKLHRRRHIPKHDLQRRRRRRAERQTPSSLPPGRALQVVGAAKVRVVGPRGALSIPWDLEEAEASMRMAGDFPSLAAYVFPRKVSGKRMARDGGDRCGWFNSSPPRMGISLIDDVSPIGMTCCRLNVTGTRCRSASSRLIC
jgi:hypothetical protein